MRTASCLALLTLVTGACGDSGGGADTPDAGAPAVPAPELGTGDHTPGSVTFTEIVGPGQLAQPRDLDFNPRRPDGFWIVNHDSDAVTLVSDASQDSRQVQPLKDAYALHFMAEPSAISFGADPTSPAVAKPGTFGSCGESRNTYDGMAAPNDFMGPTLWSSDLSIFGVQDPIGLGSHLDMLHCSPNCMGLEHQEANVYWAFGGTWDGIVKYDFGVDHGIGQDNHSDGWAYVYAPGELAYVPGVPSHLALDDATGMLYIADTGNQRLARLDTSSGTMGSPISPFEPMNAYNHMDGAVITDVVPAGAGLEAPSGVELRGDFVYVSDNATSRITAFTKDGQAANYLDTGLSAGSLAGMVFGPDGKLYFVDMRGDRVLRIDP